MCTLHSTLECVRCCRSCWGHLPKYVAAAGAAAAGGGGGSAAIAAAAAAAVAAVGAVAVVAAVAAAAAVGISTLGTSSIRNTAQWPNRHHSHGAGSDRDLVNSNCPGHITALSHVLASSGSLPSHFAGTTAAWAPRLPKGLLVQPLPHLHHGLPRSRCPQGNRPRRSWLQPNWRL